MNTPYATILLAHGSKDENWAQAIEKIALLMREQGCLAYPAYLAYTEPDTFSVLRALLAQGIKRVRIVPMFLGMGAHVRQDLPALLLQTRTQFPALEIELGEALADDTNFLAMVAGVLSARQ